MSVSVNFSARFCGASSRNYQKKDGSEGQFFSVNIFQDGGEACTLSCNQAIYDKLISTFDQFEMVDFTAEYSPQYKSFKIVDVSVA